LESSASAKRHTSSNPSNSTIKAHLVALTYKNISDLIPQRSREIPHKKVGISLISPADFCNPTRRKPSILEKGLTSISWSSTTNPQILR
jgi:hypothetical protein